MANGHYVLFSAMFSPLHSVTNEETTRQTSAIRQLLFRIVGKASHGLTATCAVSKDKCDLKKDTVSP